MRRPLLIDGRRCTRPRDGLQVIEGRTRVGSCARPYFSKARRLLRSTLLGLRERDEAELRVHHHESPGRGCESRWTGVGPHQRQSGRNAAGSGTRPPNLPQQEPPTGTMQAGVPAPLAGVRFCPSGGCPGDGALFGRAADGRGGALVYLDDEPLIDRSRHTVPRARVNLPCNSTLLMRGRAAPDGSRRDAGSAPAQLLPGPAAVSFWFSCAARSAVLY